MGLDTVIVSGEVIYRVSTEAFYLPDVGIPSRTTLRSLNDGGDIDPECLSRTVNVANSQYEGLLNVCRA